MDGDLELELVFVVEVFGDADVLVDGAEPAFDVLVLGFVEILEFSAFGKPCYAVFVGANEVEFAGGFEFGGKLVWVCCGVVMEGIFDVGGG